MTEESNCPICFMPLPSKAVKCPMCGTHVGPGGFVLPKRENENLTPSPVNYTAQEREGMRPVLEEFMAIPGMSLNGAFKLYQAGYRSLAEVIKGAFHGDEEYSTTSRLLANRMLSASVADEEEEEGKVHCPYCRSPVPQSADTCQVCGSDILIGIADLDRDFVEMNIEQFTGNILEKLQADPDFSDMPDELRYQILEVMGEDSELEPPQEITIEEEKAHEESDEEPVDDPRKARYKEKLRQWKEKGVDPSIIIELEELLESDYERFRLESVKILRERVKELRQKKA